MSPTHRLRILATSVAATAALAAPLVIGAVPANAAAGDDWLHVSGNKIVDESGKEVWLTGTNWFGFNASERVFHGLWSANITTLTKSMADRGINTVRVPISTQLLLEWKAGTFLKPNVNTYANPELEGKNSLQIFDYWLTLCEKYGIKVFLDVHSAEADNAGHVYPVWWKGSITTDDVYAGWEWVAERYKNNDTIVGADVKNEPHGTQGSTERAKWDGSTDKDNFKHFAETAGRKILAINPNWLIFVEGIEVYPKPGVPWTSTGLTDYYGTWWGGNLRGVRDFPINLGSNQDQLVYSPHDYGPLVFEQKWFQGTWDRTTLERDVWDPNWLYLHKENISPLLIGEWGGFMDGGRNEKWMVAIRDLIVDRRLSHTFWVLNPNSGDTGGLLNYDWTTWDEPKYALLKPSLWQDGGKFVGLDHQVPLGGTGSTTGKSVSDVGGQTGDTTAPTTPANLSAGTPSTTSIPLSWSASTDSGSGVAGYQVYQGTTLVGNTTSTSLTVTGLSPDTAYSFSVRAKDVAGNVSAASTAVTARTAVVTGSDTVAPSVPTGLEAGTGTTTSIPLRWNASTDSSGGSGVAGYDVYRAGTLVGSSTTPSYTATGLAAGTSYVFTVVAKDVAGNRSAASTALTAYTAPEVSTGSCAVTYTANSWSTGFTGSVKITNTGTSPLAGWTLAFTYANGQKVTQGWSATWSQTGSAVTATGVAWNSTLAPGASTEIGFNGTHIGTNTAPTSFTINGAACTVK
ncbi:cellulase family glycosylhydrolase [Cellulomonas humilata]|uniref:cellulase n=1 Tax=Cellulomonas humilata TaxID=144055 RepID=A0ABU0EH00_9CELL|nr:cellulase family glycosylhydrolase [Cellulomonas humilata]MDQ0374554.1 aryl-phospho-beta-D-glucosidase BglC (GH1 family) [Cellulomonas humilata]